MLQGFKLRKNILQIAPVVLTAILIAIRTSFLFLCNEDYEKANYIENQKHFLIKKMLK